MDEVGFEHYEAEYMSDAFALRICSVDKDMAGLLEELYH